MSILEFWEDYRKKSLKEITIKELTESFNKLEVEDRLKVLSKLSEEDKNKFIREIRQQAVADFWTHERELIQQGQSTRNWTPEQIEDIMHISEKTGKVLKDGTVAYDVNGKAYCGHHMLNVADHPEYAGDYRNIQALDYTEHYGGAHNNQTAIPIDGYYEGIHDRRKHLFSKKFRFVSPNVKLLILSDYFIFRYCQDWKNVYNERRANLRKRKDAKLEV